MDSDNLPGILGIGIIIGFCVLAYYGLKDAAEKRQQFAAETTRMYNDCIAAKETKYTCQNIVESRKAQQAAKDAESEASIAAGMAGASIGASMGASAGRR